MLAVRLLVFIRRVRVQILWNIGENWFVQPQKTDVSISAKKNSSHRTSIKCDPWSW